MNQQTKNSMIDCANNIGWTVTINPETNTWSFSFPSCCGVDFKFSAEADSISADVKKAYDEFDPDKYVDMWVNVKNSGAAGIPSYRDIVREADKIDEALETLSDKLEEIQEEYMRLSELKPFVVEITETTIKKIVVWSTSGQAAIDEAETLHRMGSEIDMLVFDECTTEYTGGTPANEGDLENYENFGL